MIPDIKHPAFPKITRFFEQTICITEKIDGTNGVIYIDDSNNVFAGSRNRWITPEDDNYGFARWVQQNQEELKLLGPGIHYGEWWGVGIQRGYNMDRRVFSLFNVHRWSDDTVRPKCCDVVPTLFQGSLNDFSELNDALDLKHSYAAQKYGIDYNKPEGSMMYFTGAGVYFKVPLETGHKG